jgi:predicted phosphodiesterase
LHIAIISDVHANLEALRAVMAHLEDRQVRTIVCAGDIVGYGPRPAEVIDLIQSRSEHCIRGNHDHAVVTGDFESFSKLASRAGHWTREQLRPLGGDDPHRQRRWDYLSNLPLSAHLGELELCHGSPRSPLTEYIFPPSSRQSAALARNLLGATDARMLVLGHTHVPMLLGEDGTMHDVRQFEEGGVLPSGRLVLNPGSVGQPRDGDSRAAYVEIDRDRAWFHRVPYPVAKLAYEVAAIDGLGRDLAERLLVGR